MTELTIEQQFSIRSFESQVQRMSHAQAQEFLVKLYEQMIIREALYKEFIQNQWGTGDKLRAPQYPPQDH